ncbi:MAG: hypothetical protein CMO55_27435 [Verrucomicrobiales bacterium]|nr:hypothetical protein [Verrucomicrobiales bacterium]
MTDPTHTKSSAPFSIASVLAVICAIFSFTSGAIFGFILALLAIVFGLTGVLIALSPARRGGFASTFAVIAGVAGIIAAIVKAIIWLL